MEHSHDTETRFQVKMTRARKAKVEAALKEMGLDHIRVINLLYDYIERFNDLPLGLAPPSQSTLDALNQSKDSKLKKFETEEALFEEFGL